MAKPFLGLGIAYRGTRLATESLVPQEFVLFRASPKLLISLCQQNQLPQRIHIGPEKH